MRFVRWRSWIRSASFWHVLTRDVAVVGGLQSPLLSWIGAAAILTLCLWHSAVLIRGLLHIQRTLSRFQSSVAPLILARRQVSKDWLVIPALAKRRTNLAESPETRRDLDDLQALDRAVRSEQAFARDWLSYRKTLAVEQSAWFLEPTVHSQRSASEFFSFESLCAAHLNVRFYRQLPAFMTGMGLMFTFLAILIGLSKLHANGSEIDGIQGLINGLSGKFVTSIVGLACANAFTLLENSLWHRLDNRHRECVCSSGRNVSSKGCRSICPGFLIAERTAHYHSRSRSKRCCASACRGRAATPRINRRSTELRRTSAHGSEFQTFADEA